MTALRKCSYSIGVVDAHVAHRDDSLAVGVAVPCLLVDLQGSFGGQHTN